MKSCGTPAWPRNGDVSPADAGINRVMIWTEQKGDQDHEGEDVSGY